MWESFTELTRDILARAPDKHTAQSVGGYLSYSNCVTNTADARRMLVTWAELLRDGLDELHGK